VAATAIIDDSHVIEISGAPGIACTAVVAGITAGNVSWMFTCCGNAIVGGIASTNNLEMVHRKDRNPDIGGMAVFTNVTGLDMCRWLALRLRAVVTAEAVTYDIDVIEVCGRPAGRRMTIIASVATADMRRILAGSDDAIVARTAGSDDLSMVDRRDWLPCVAGVAVLAYLGRLDMR